MAHVEGSAPASKSTRLSLCFETSGAVRRSSACISGQVRLRSEATNCPGLQFRDSHIRQKLGA